MGLIWVMMPVRTPSVIFSKSKYPSRPYMSLLRITSPLPLASLFPLALTVTILLWSSQECGGLPCPPQLSDLDTTVRTLRFGRCPVDTGRLEKVNTQTDYLFTVFTPSLTISLFSDLCQEEDHRAVS